MKVYGPVRAAPQNYYVCVVYVHIKAYRAAGRIRTCDQETRRLLLWQTELLANNRAHHSVV